MLYIFPPNNDVVLDCLNNVTCLPTLFTKVTSAEWILDSGAMSHVTGQGSVFSHLGRPPPNTRVVGVGGATEVTGQGKVKLAISAYGVDKTFTIDEVLYAPGLPFNIISVKKLCLYPNGTETDLRVTFSGNTCEIVRKSTDSIIATGTCVGSNLYKVQLQRIPPAEEYIYTTVTEQSSLYVWHRRLGHLKETRLRKLLKDVLGIAFPADPMERCEPCYRATLAKRNFTTPGKRATRPLQRLHLDVGGPVNTRQGKQVVQRYWLVIVDDFTRYRWVRLLQYKSDVNQEFRNFKAWAEAEFKTQIGSCRSDNGGEFTNNDLTSLYNATGIQIELTAPYNPQQNGVAERSMQILLNHVRCILEDSGLPEHCYGEVLKTVCYLVNFHPTAPNEFDNPHFRLFNEQPPIAKLRAIGCECWKPVPRGSNLRKLDSRGEKCYLLGYGLGDHQYRVWNADLERVELVRDLNFEEDIFVPKDVLIPETANHTGVIDKEIIQDRINAWMPRRSKRLALSEGENRNPNIASLVEIPSLISLEGEFNDHYRLSDPDLEPTLVASQVEALKQSNAYEGDIIKAITSLICSMEQNQGKEWLTLPAEVTRNLDLVEPKTYEAAIKGQDGKKWTVAIEMETDSLTENDTYTITARPTDQKVLSGKYVFKIKTDAQGAPDRYKARWVVRGFEQEYGVDFQETFASVVKPMSYRVLFALACMLGWEIDQMDVKTAFLYGLIDTEVYVELPPNLQAKHPGKVCKLKKALYGLKQAPKIWFDTLRTELKKLGFENINEDYSIFIQQRTGVIIGVYVDDLLIIGKDRVAIDEVKSELSKHFKMVDLGPASYYLGIKLSRHWTKHGNKLCLSQKAYTSKILKDFNAGPDGAVFTAVATPMDPKLVLEPAPSDFQASGKDKLWYQSAVGSLMYLMLCTRPDITYAVSQLSRYSSNPTDKHKTAVKHVFRYLQGTSNLGLVFDSSKRDLGLCGYTDANWARDHDKRSTGGYVYMLCGTIISWSSKRQATVALSSCEAEYIAETEAAKEAIWLKRLLNNFHFKTPEAVKIKGDNKGALALAKNPEFHSRTKHIDIRYHFVRQKVEEGLVDLEWIGTASNLADGMTKPLSGTPFQSFRRGIGMQVVLED